MYITKLRKVGGSIMLTLPPALPDVLRLQVGAKVRLAVDNGRLVVEPAARLRYTMTELLAKFDCSQPKPAQPREWVGWPCGRTRADMRRGDIHMTDLDPTQRRDQRGHRPVVIVSPDVFDRATGLPVRHLADHERRRFRPPTWLCRAIERREHNGGRAVRSTARAGSERTQRSACRTSAGGNHGQGVDKNSRHF